MPPASVRIRKPSVKFSNEMKGKKLKTPKNTLLKTDDGYPVKEEVALFYPSSAVAFRAILCFRIVSAIWLHITDCDETYNYWEPTHYLLFDNGFQTWEYSPQYALRSYVYLLINAVPAWLYNAVFHPSRLLLFYFIRCILAVFCAVAEVYFYKSVCREFGINIGRIMVVILIFSPGMFISSTAFLPSSFSMYMTLFSIGAWFHRKYSLAIFSTALSTFVSWPFSVLIGIAIAHEMVIIQKRWRTFLLWSSFSAFTILIPLVEIDSLYYGKFTVAPYNIVKYNIFTSHGPNIYGTEQWYFYILNGILNFNCVFLIALSTPLLLVWIRIVLPKKPRNPDCFPYVLSLGSLYLWLFVFLLQPHKEERFLFPVYPLIALCGAVGIDALQVLYFRYLIGKGVHYAKSTVKVAAVILLLYSLLGVSRIFALYKAYHAPMDTFIELAKIDADLTDKNEMNLCIGKEWHRFPSSFFLPDRWKLRFVKSEFRGLLPAYFLSHPNGTKTIRTDMNDLNKEEPSRYVAIETCNYLIDMDSDSPTELEPIYSSHSNWTSVYSLPFLNAAKTPFYLRSFYIPFLWEWKISVLPFHLLRFNETSRKMNRSKNRK